MKREVRVLSLAIIILLLSIFLTGCWDSKEVEDIAVVTATGFDKITVDGVDKWQVSACIMHRSKGEQGDLSATKDATSEIIIKGTGFTVEDAFMDFVGRIPLSAFYGHDNILIFGGRATEENIKELTEQCLRYPETRPQAYILVTKGEAFNVLQAESLVNSTISQEIKRLIEDKAKRSGIAYGVPFYEFTDWLLSSDRDVVLPQIKLFYPEKGEKTVRKSITVEGLGVFRGKKLAGWLDEDESKGYMFITQNISRAQIAIPVSKDGKMFTYWLTNSKSKIEVRMTGDKPSFLIKIETQGGVYENTGFELTPERIKVLEEAIGGKIQELTLQTITIAKEYDTDFLGLMEKMHRYYPSAWEKVAPNWRESFSKADVDVEVDAKIVSVGKLAKNLLIKQ